MPRFLFTMAVFFAGWLFDNRPSAAQAIQYLSPPSALQQLPVGPAYVARVVDARPGHPALGYTKLGGTIAQPIFFQEELALVMQTFFARYAPGQPAAVPLVARVLDLRLTETFAHGLPVVSAAVQTEFYAVQPDSSYRLVARFSSAQQKPVAGGTSAVLVSHAANLGNLFLSAAAVGSNQTAWVAGPVCAASTVFAVPPLPAATPAILQPATVLNPGFYYSLSDFLTNSPLEPGVPEVEARPYLGTEWAGDFEIKPYRRDASGQRVLATSVWGFCDGQQAYIRQGTNFYKLRLHERAVDFFGRAGTGPVLHSAINVVAVATMVSGYGGIISTNPEHRVLYQLDLKTGTSTPSMSVGLATGLSNDRPTQLFIYRPRSAKGPAARLQLATDQPVQELAAGDYLSFSPPAGAVVQVSLLPATGPAIVLPVLPTTTAPIYLECRPAEAEPLRQVKDAVGASAITRLLK